MTQVKELNRKKDLTNENYGRWGLTKKFIRKVGAIEKKEGLFFSGFNDRECRYARFCLTEHCRCYDCPYLFLGCDNDYCCSYITIKIK